MGKVTFLSLPLTCWKQLFSCMWGHLKQWPSSFTVQVSLLTLSISLSYHSPCCLWVGGGSMREVALASVGCSAGPAAASSSPQLISLGTWPGCRSSHFVFCPQWVCVPTKTLDPEHGTQSRKKKTSGSYWIGGKMGTQAGSEISVCVLSRPGAGLEPHQMAGCAGGQSASQGHNGRGTT